MSFYRWDNENLIIDLRIQPRASQCAFAGPYGQRYKVRLTAAPADNKANQQLANFLGQSFAVAPSHIRILSGGTGRNKRVLIQAPGTIPPVLREAGIRNPE